MFGGEQVVHIILECFLIIRGQYQRCLSIFVELTSIAREFVNRSPYMPVVQ